ncbi:hypothetical protein DYB28_008213, partial [Aphanomyces astaci]
MKTALIIATVAASAIGTEMPKASNRVRRFFESESTAKADLLVNVKLTSNVASLDAITTAKASNYRQGYVDLNNTNDIALPDVIKGDRSSSRHRDAGNEWGVETVGAPAIWKYTRGKGVVGSAVDCSKGVNVVNNPWAAHTGYNPWFEAAIAAWKAARIIPVFGIANRGLECSLAASPGATWFYYVRSVGIASNSAYASDAGTSMAFPHVAGVVALLKSVDLSLDFDAVYTNLTATADQNELNTTEPHAWLASLTNETLPGSPHCGAPPDDSWPNNRFGYGRVNVATILHDGKLNDKRRPTGYHLLASVRDTLGLTADAVDDAVADWQAVHSTQNLGMQQQAAAAAPPHRYTAAAIAALYTDVSKHLKDLNAHSNVAVRAVTLPSDDDIAALVESRATFFPEKYPVAAVDTINAANLRTRDDVARPGGGKRANGAYVLVAGKQRAVPAADLPTIKGFLRKHSIEMANTRLGLQQSSNAKKDARSQSVVVGKQALISELMRSTKFNMHDIFQMSCQFKELARKNGTISCDHFATIIGSHLGKLVGSVTRTPITDEDSAMAGVSSIGETISASNALVQRLYGVFDQDLNGSIDFRGAYDTIWGVPCLNYLLWGVEFIIGINSLVQGTLEQKLDSLFKMYDKDG